MASPQCYYHPSNFIQSFCLHPGCILPLCQECVQIHQKQNSSGDHRSLIVGYKQARQIAIDTIKREEQNIQKTEKEFHNKFIEFRTKILSIVEKQLWGIEERLSKSQYSFEGNRAQLKQRKKSISEGSLKDLINHFEKGSGYGKSNFNFESHIDPHKIVQAISSSYVINKQKSDDISEKFNTKIDELKSESQSSVCVNDHVCLAESVTTSKKLKRKGIFVASSPEAKKISQSCEKMRNCGNEKPLCRSQGMQKSQSVRNSRATEKKNIYCNQFTYSVKDFSHKSLIRPHSEKRLKIEYKESVESKFGKILIDSSNSQNLPSEKWRKVVNTKDTSKCSQNHSRLRLSTMENLHEDVLNPKQMRELIMKKRGKNDGGNENSIFCKKNIVLRQF